jgi:hypothetical protein
MREETRTAQIELTTEGMIQVRIKPRVMVTAADARESVDAMLRLAGSQRRLVLIHGTGSSLIEKAACREFLGNRIAEKTLAAALNVESRPGRIVGSLVIKKLKQEGISMPVKVFGQSEEAVDWLNLHLNSPISYKINHVSGMEPL